MVKITSNFIKKLAKGCASLNCCHSEIFRLELNITPIIANIDNYRKCWGVHLP